MPRKGGVPENLKPFKKGDDPRRNIAGRPPSLITQLQEILSEQITDRKSGKSMDKGNAILTTLVALALKGDMRAIQEILDRLHGKARQEIDLHLPELKVQPLSDDEKEKIDNSLAALNESNDNLPEEP